MKKKLLPSLLIILPVCLFVGYLCLFDDAIHESFDTFRVSYAHSSDSTESGQLASNALSFKSYRFTDPILIEKELQNIDHLKNSGDSEWDPTGKTGTADQNTSLQEDAEASDPKDNSDSSGLSDTEPGNSDAEIYYVVVNHEK